MGTPPNCVHLTFFWPIFYKNRGVSNSRFYGNPFVPAQCAFRNANLCENVGIFFFEANITLPQKTYQIVGKPTKFSFQRCNFWSGGAWYLPQKKRDMERKKENACPKCQILTDRKKIPVTKSTARDPTSRNFQKKKKTSKQLYIR